MFLANENPTSGFSYKSVIRNYYLWIQHLDIG